MNPADPSSFNHRTELLSTGRRYHFVDQLPANYDPATTKTLICVHGFPDLWYGWRYQIKPWVELGYRVVVPDKLGYGGTDKPEDAVEYTSRRIANDIAALMDLLEIPKAVIIGHDWGCFMVSRFALWHPDRLLALVLMSVPYIPPTKGYISLEQMVERFPNWGYQLYFQDKKSNAEIERNLPKFFTLMYKKKSSPETTFTLPGRLEDIINSKPVPVDTGLLTQQEFDYYLSQFENSMNGPLNYYRTTSARFQEEKEHQIMPTPRPDLPVLLIIGKSDPTANQSALETTKKLIPQIQIELIDGVGHWLMVQSKDYITERIPQFLREVLATNGTKL